MQRPQRAQARRRLGNRLRYRIEVIALDAFVYGSVTVRLRALVG